MRKTVEIVIYALLIIIFVALQSTIFRYIAFLNCAPQVVLILVVSVAVLRGQFAGALVGLIAGLLIDILGGRAIGFNAILYMYIGFFVAWISDRFYNTRYKVVLIFVIAANVVYDLLYYFFSFVIWGKGDLIAALWRVMLPEIWWTLILAVPVFWVIEKLDRITA